MIDIITTKLFYPSLFITIGIVLVVFICSAKAILIKFKDKDSQNFIFQTHVQEHTDTTSKMKSMHDNIINLPYTNLQEQEFHSLECNIKKLQDTVNDLNDKVNELCERILTLEQNTK